MQERRTTNPVGRQVPRLREQQGEVTRRAILEAARDVFRERGYTQASMRMLADRAGVAVQTIYSTFGSKPGVVAGLLESMAQDPNIREVAQRLLESRDADETVLLAAQLLRNIRERGGDILHLLRQAVAADPKIGEVFEAGFSRHRDGMIGMCRKLAEAGQLRGGLAEESAIGMALAITSLDAYEEVVGRRGWTHDQYEQWLAETLRFALLGRVSRGAASSH